MKKIIHGKRSILVISIIIFILNYYKVLGLDPILDDFCLFNYEDTITFSYRSIFDRFNFDEKRIDPFEQSVITWQVWWTDSKLQSRFFRPVSSMLYYMDERIPGRSPYTFRIHSLLWGILFIIACNGAIGRAVGGMAGGIATLAIAVSPVVDISIIWISNRCHLVAMVFSVLSVYFYLRHRDKSLRCAPYLMFLFLILALGSSEMGCSGLITVYILELGRSEQAENKGFTLLIPFIGIGAAYAAVYTLGKYGVKNSGYYIHFLSDPYLYLKAFLARYPLLLGGSLGLILSHAPEGIYPPYVYVAVFLIVISFSYGFYLSVREEDSQSKNRIFMLFIAGLISLIPMVSAPPTYRSLMISICPFAGILAYQICSIKKVLKREGKFARAFYLAWSAFIAFSLFFVNPGAQETVKKYFTDYASQTRRIIMESEIESAKTFNDHIFAINSISPIFDNTYMAFTYNYYHRPHWIGYWYVMTMTEKPLRLTVLDRSRIEISLLEGDILSHAGSGLFRKRDKSFRKGDVINHSRLVVKILDVADGIPTRFVFEFPTPVDNPNYRFVTWEDGRFVKVDLPAAGQSLEFKAPALPKIFL
ncbi:MAG: hypothetical protein HQK54_04550 [Oligoflexales bacterium]|nr:hypothetical protein [Oligoflexales bacterium]